jgi:hypothetical protein
MRRVPVVLCTVLVVVSFAQAADQVRLQARSLRPLTVRGTGFQPSERITLSLTASGVRTVARVNVGDSGIFVVVFRRAVVNRCDGFLLRAKGSKGSAAALRSPQLMCMNTNPG